MHYQEIASLKEELRQLRQSLDILKGLEPTDERLGMINDITARAKSITHYIRMKCKQYGFTVSFLYSDISRMGNC